MDKGVSPYFRKKHPKLTNFSIDIGIKAHYNDKAG